MVDHVAGLNAPASSPCPECSERLVEIRGRCGRCYRRWRLQQLEDGTFTKTFGARSLRDRLLEKTTPGPGGCVIWTATTNDRGYGMTSEGSRKLYAHRAAYALFIGAIPDGAVIDHTCHNRDASCAGGPTCLHRRCINPHHLEATTSKENISRSDASAVNWTHCTNGHPFNEVNTYYRPDREGRQCRACNWLRSRGDAPDCGYLSRAGNACRRPAGHEGQHFSKGPSPEIEAIAAAAREAGGAR